MRIAVISSGQRICPDEIDGRAFRRTVEATRCAALGAIGKVVAGRLLAGVKGVRIVPDRLSAAVERMGLGKDAPGRGEQHEGARERDAMRGAAAAQGSIGRTLAVHRREFL
jgi:hypothetical protein